MAHRPAPTEGSWLLQAPGCFSLLLSLHPGQMMWGQGLAGVLLEAMVRIPCPCSAALRPSPIQAPVGQAAPS